MSLFFTTHLSWEISFTPRASTHPVYSWLSCFLLLGPFFGLQTYVFTREETSPLECLAVISKSTQRELTWPQTHSSRVPCSRNPGACAIWGASPPSSFIARSGWVNLPDRFQLPSLLFYPHFHCLRPHSQDFSPWYLNGLMSAQSLLSPVSPSTSYNTHTWVLWSAGPIRNSYLITSLNKILQCLPSRTCPCFSLNGPSISFLCPNDFWFPDPSEI